MIRMSIWILLLLLPRVASAQTMDTTLPAKMAGFFKPGMHIGIQSNDTSDVVTINVYTSEDYKDAKAIATMTRIRALPASDVAKMIPAVDVELNRYIEKNEVKADQIDGILVNRLPRISLGTISGIGDDFLLVALNDDMKKRRVVPLSRISSIYLDANPVHFITR